MSFIFKSGQSKQNCMAIDPVPSMTTEKRIEENVFCYED
jgi:hypothetical protein